MARIQCHYLDCMFLDDGYCSAPAIKLDPEMGCLTYRTASETGDDDEDLLDDWDLEDLGISDLLEDDWDDDSL